MGNNVPNTINDAIAWYEDRMDQWQSSAAQIGLAAGTATTIKTLATTARDKYIEAEKARAVSEAATLELKNAAAALRVVGSGAISTIKGFAATTNNPNVFAIAMVSPPSPPSVLPPPNAPTDVTAELLLNGALKLKWKASQPGSGTVYRIARQFNGTGEFITIDTVGEKNFTDNSIPYGTDAVTYRISARRGGVNSASQTTLNLQFGSVQGNGQQSFTFTSENGKLAA